MTGWLVNLLRYIPCLFFIAAYYSTGEEEVLWLFAATFALIQAKGDEIKEVIKGCDS